MMETKISRGLFKGVNDTVTNVSQWYTAAVPSKLLLSQNTNKQSDNTTLCDALWENKAAQAPQKYRLVDFSEEGNSFTATLK